MYRYNKQILLLLIFVSVMLNVVFFVVLNSGSSLGVSIGTSPFISTDSYAISSKTLQISDQLNNFNFSYCLVILLMIFLVLLLILLIIYLKKRDKKGEASNYEKKHN